MAVIELAYEVNPHAKKINDCKNGELTLAQAKTMNSRSEQMNALAVSMTLMFAQSAETTNLPLLTIRTSAIDATDDLSPTITSMRNREKKGDGKSGMRFREEKEDGALNEASAAKIARFLTRAIRN